MHAGAVRPSVQASVCINVAQQSGAVAAHHHAHANPDLLHSQPSDMARVAVCYWSRCWLYAAVPACEDHLTVSNMRYLKMLLGDAT